MSESRIVGKTSLLSATFQEVVVENTGKLNVFDSTNTDGTAKVRCFGVDTANGNTQVQVNVDSLGRISNASMNRFLTTPPSLSNGQSTDSLCDSNGNMLVKVLGKRFDNSQPAELAVNSLGELYNVNFKEQSLNPTIANSSAQGVLGRVLMNATTSNTGGQQRTLKCDTDGTLKVIAKDKVILSLGDNVVIADGAFQVGSFDLRPYSKVRIYGNSSVNSLLEVQYSDDNSNWKYIDTLTFLTTNGNIAVNKVIDCPPAYLRIVNTSGVSHTLGIRLMCCF